MTSLVSFLIRNKNLISLIRLIMNREEVEMLIVAIIVVALIIWKSFVLSKASKTRSGWAVLASMVLPPPVDAVVFLWKSKC